MSVQNYVKQAELVVSDLSLSAEFAQTLRSVLAAEPVAGNETLLSYPVPKLTADGTCSVPDDLDPKPYHLKETFLLNGFDSSAIVKFVTLLDTVVALLHAETAADWTGIYKKMRTKQGTALVKVAYRGRPSRAEFPLTEAFAAHSNNSTVGLSGKAVMVSSVQEHIANGKPYYECDNAVQSELCLPVFSKNGEVAGIIDIESFRPNHFSEDLVMKAAEVCDSLEL